MLVPGLLISFDCSSTFKLKIPFMKNLNDPLGIVCSSWVMIIRTKLKVTTVEHLFTFKGCASKSAQIKLLVSRTYLFSSMW
jgi:hypothetical protein